MEYESIDYNPVRDLSKKTIGKRQREVISLEKFKEIITELKNKHYNLHRFLLVFFYASVRTTEILSVQKKHVDLDKQEYEVLIKKGKQYVWVKKIIIPATLPYWKDIYSNTRNPEDFLFSHRLVPGKKKLNRQQISKYWLRWVKNPKGITEDFYSLKHLFTDMLDEFQNSPNFDLAQEMASHTNSNTTDIYRTGKEKRKNENLKKVSISIN